MKRKHKIAVENFYRDDEVYCMLQNFGARFRARRDALINWQRLSEAIIFWRYLNRSRHEIFDRGILLQLNSVPSSRWTYPGKEKPKK